MKNLFIIPVFVLLGSCSDKYKSIYESAPSPGLSFSKDVVTIREKDYTNINQTNNGLLTLYCSSTDHQLNIQFNASSDKVHFMYFGEEIKSRQALIAMDSVRIFCTADTAGVYSVDFYLTDQLGKTTQRQLIVNSLANKAAKAGFYFLPLVNSQLQSWAYLFDGSPSQDPDGIITAYYYSINGQQIMTTQPVMNWTFHAKGTHDIGLYVTDDLGRNSDTVHQQILIP